MLQFHGCTGIGAEEALSEMAGLSLEQPDYQVLMPLGPTELPVEGGAQSRAVKSRLG
jgi:hypothetical protein